MSLDFTYDGHKILAVLDLDQVRPQVVCPGIEKGDGLDPDQRRRLCCGQGEERVVKSEPDFCAVTESIAEYGWETNVTGLNIMIRDLIPIEYGWEDGETFFWKVAGYPSERQVKQFREEASSALEIDVMHGRRFPAAMFGMLPLKPWAEVDPEAKEQLREDLKLHIEHEERKRREQRARQNR